MSEKLAGIISPEDEQLLQVRISTDPAVRQAWEVYCARFSASDIREGFPRADAIAWQKVPQRRRPLLKNLAYITAAGAVAAGICFFIFRPAAMVAPDPVTAGVRLVMADGRELHAEAAPQAKGIKMDISGLQVDEATVTVPSSAMNTLYVPPGKSYRVILPDSTQIRVNASSTLRFPSSFSGKSRRVELTGEAFFEVAADAQRPFMVQSGGGEVTVLGTAFNIRAYNTGAGSVSLINGGVKVRHGNREVILTPGREAVWSDSEVLTERAFRIEEVTGWKEGAYYFDSAPLTAIADVIRQWYGVEVRVTGEARFSGRLDRQLPLAAFLRQLEATGTFSHAYLPDGALDLTAR